MSKAKTKNELQAELEQAHKRIAELESAATRREELPASAFDASPLPVTMAESEACTRELLEVMPDAIFTIDADGKILMANAQAEKMFGYSQKELVGAAVETLIPNSLRGGHVENRAKFMQQPHSVTTSGNRKIFGLRQGGQEFPAEVSLSYHKLASGEVVVLCAIRDVTERNRSADLIASQRDLAKLASANLPKEEVWDLCLREVMRVSSFDSGGLYLFDEDSRVFNLVRQQGLSVKFADATARFGEDTPSAKMVLSGNAIYFTESDLQVKSYHRAEGLRSAVVIPIQHHGRVLGCLNIASHTLPNIPDWSRTALEIVALEIGNIITHRRMEESLQSSSKQLSRALVTAHMGTWRYHVPTARIDWSPEAASIFGIENQQNDFGAILAQFHPDDRVRTIAALQEALSQKKILRMEYRMFDVKGNMRWVAIYGQVECDTEGNPQQTIMGLIQDITERKVMEDKLRESEIKYRELINGMNDTVWVIDSDARILDVNNAAAMVLGYTREELLSMKISDIDAELAPEKIQRLIAAMLTDKAQIFETWHATKDGKKLPFEISSSLVLYLGKTVIMSIARDISERRNFENALVVNEQKLKSLIDSETHFVIRVNMEGKYSYWNQSFEREFGWLYAAEGMSKSSVLTAVCSYHHERVKEVVAKCVAQPGQVFSVEIDKPAKNGGVRTTLWEFICLTDENKAPAEIQCMGIEITGRKQAEEALTKSQTLLTEAQRIGHIGHMEWRSGESTLICSDEVYNILNLPRETVITQKLLTEMMTSEEKDRIQQLDLQFIQQREEMNYEYRIRLKNGSERWIHQIGRITYDQNGAPARMIAIIQDVTERKQAEESLRESEEKYRGLMESLNNAISTVDQNGTFLYMNDRAAESLGGTPQELIGKKIQETFPEPFASRQMAAVQEVFQINRETVYETQSMVKNGLRWYRAAFQPLHDEAGQVAQVLVNVTDIHDLKTAQQELQELNHTLEEKVAQRAAEVQDLYDNAPSGYHSLDINGNYILVNQTELNWMGYTREEMIGHTAQEFLPEESREIFRKNFPLFLQRGWLKDLELDFMRKDGSLLPVSLNATALYDEFGKFVMSRSTIFDITERKKAERALRENEEQNRLLFEESPIPIALLDETGHIIHANRVYAELTGFPRSALYGKTAEETGLVEPDVTTRLTESMIDALSRQENFALVEHFLTSADGTKRIVESRIFILQINSINHILVTTSDISAHKKAEETLLRVNLELERAMRMKDEFLATMSHELRTPLTGILGLSEALQLETYGSLSDRQIVTIKNIENSGRHLLELINDVLDLSKVEAGKLELQIERCSLKDISQSSLHLTKGMAHQKRQQVRYSAPIDPIFLNVDSRRIKQVIVNLISNAIKFTPESGELGLTVEPDEANQQVRLAVWDKGIGIKSENLPKLFKPFTQIDSSLAREYSGTGLGLALVRRLVELHNGSVKVESKFGEGSRFIVTLPYLKNPLPNASAAAVGAELPQGAVDEDPSSPMILIVDDNEVLLEMMCDFLEAKHFRTAQSQSGRELLEKIESIKPNVILMDIQMPGMDGLETIRRVRAHPNAEIASAPIIAITALAMPGDKELCLEAGANDYISKPLKLRDLSELLNQWTRGRK